MKGFNLKSTARFLKSLPVLQFSVLRIPDQREALVIFHLNLLTDPPSLATTSALGGSPAWSCHRAPFLLASSRFGPWGPRNVWRGKSSVFPLLLSQAVFLSWLVSPLSLFLSKPLYWLSRAAVTEYHTLGGLIYFPPDLEARKSKIKGLESWFLLRPCSLACRWPPSCCVLTRSYLCVCAPWCLSVSKSPLLMRL